ncbi:MAG: methionyl-tRNA formyltransferase [Thermoleophilaceae bacterium]|jgi:methionyl-tRNA formyltransferase|nr:methionyl-tRNA formyltransferase [Thermoleophilaceae bacterium]
MRTVYLGTSPFAATVLERLARSQHRPALVITRPDRPRGRGRRLAPPPVAEAARALGIELAQPADVNAPEARERIAAAEPEVVAICAFGALIREPLLSEYEMLNVHPSLLPRWRGAAPIERAIEAGDAVTGVSIMRPVAAMDAGPVCLASDEPIRPEDDFGSLSARLAELGGELLVDALDRRPPCREQPEDGVTIAPKIEAGDRMLDPRREGARQLELRVRALTPHVGASIELPGEGGESEEGERLGVRGARALVPAAASYALAPGALTADGGRLLLGCADGALELLEVQPAGGRAMAGADWLRGSGAALVAGAAGDRTRGCEPLP